MKKSIILFISVILCVSAQSQNFKLSFIDIDKFLTQKYSLTKIENSLKPYTIVKKGEKEWKFRDDSKSWEAILYVQFDASTKIIKEIQFAAPDSRVYDFIDELKEILGFVHVATYGKMDVYENKQKNLGAKIVPADWLGENITLYRMYKL